MNALTVITTDSNGRSSTMVKVPPPPMRPGSTPEADRAEDERTRAQTGKHWLDTGGKVFEIMKAYAEQGIAPGAYTGTATDDRLDPLDIIAELAEGVAQSFQTEAASTDYRTDCTEFRMLRRAQRILMLNARHVPHAVDQVIDTARAHGGIKS